MRRAITAIPVLAALVLAGCSSPAAQADPAACKTAIAGQYQDAAAAGEGVPEEWPAGCEGVDDATAQRLTEEILTEALDAAEGGVSPECRTWIKAELLDNGEDIDAASGYGACGGLSDEEMGRAIDEVTAELSAEIAPSAG